VRGAPLDENERLDAAMQHAAAVHKHQDTPELRQPFCQLFKTGAQPA
jgi:TorA maturation chaperone TorD